MKIDKQQALNKIKALGGSHNLSEWDTGYGSGVIACYEAIMSLEAECKDCKHYAVSDCTCLTQKSRYFKQVVGPSWVCEVWAIRR